MQCRFSLTVGMASVDPAEPGRFLLRRAMPTKPPDMASDKKSMCSTVETVVDYTENKIQTG